jgi:hypothetical protein
LLRNQRVASGSDIVEREGAGVVRIGDERTTGNVNERMGNRGGAKSDGAGYRAGTKPGALGPLWACRPSWPLWACRTG